MDIKKASDFCICLILVSIYQVEGEIKLKSLRSVKLHYINAAERFYT